MHIPLVTLRFLSSHFNTQTPFPCPVHEKLKHSAWTSQILRTKTSYTVENKFAVFMASFTVELGCIGLVSLKIRLAAFIP
jgi:hypothetical protein